MKAGELSPKAVIRDTSWSRKNGVQPERNIKLLFWCLAMLLGGVQAWLARARMSADTISYLDMGNYLRHGHWSQIINGLWNPLYASLLGLMIGLFRPSL